MSTSLRITAQRVEQRATSLVKVATKLTKSRNRSRRVLFAVALLINSFIIRGTTLHVSFVKVVRVRILFENIFPPGELKSEVFFFERLSRLIQVLMMH